jgi:transcriptional regulator with XRE-family HTH domain
MDGGRGAVDVSLVIRQRLDELGLEQKDLARAARVTESYISQLLARKRAPPAPTRTDIYPRMERFLKLPAGDLARLAALQRREELQRELGTGPAPLLRDVRAIILRKCEPATTGHVRAIFEREPFGELERLVTQQLVDVVKRAVRQGLDHEPWLRVEAQRAGRGVEEIRVIAREFLDTELVHLSADQGAVFLDPLIASWDIDLASFALDVVLDRRAAERPRRRFEFVERGPRRTGEEPGLTEFLADPALSRTVTPDELEFLRRLEFQDRRPTAVYYYRELQNLRDPLHFRDGEG